MQFSFTIEYHFLFVFPTTSFFFEPKTPFLRVALANLPLWGGTTLPLSNRARWGFNITKCYWKPLMRGIFPSFSATFHHLVDVNPKICASLRGTLNPRGEKWGFDLKLSRDHIFQNSYVSPWFGGLFHVLISISYHFGPLIIKIGWAVLEICTKICMAPSDFW